MAPPGWLGTAQLLASSSEVQCFRADQLALDVMDIRSFFGKPPSNKAAPTTAAAPNKLKSSSSAQENGLQPKTAAGQSKPAQAAEQESSLIMPKAEMSKGGLPAMTSHADSDAMSGAQNPRDAVPVAVMPEAERATSETKNAPALLTTKRPQAMVSPEEFFTLASQPSKTPKIEKGEVVTQPKTPQALQAPEQQRVHQPSVLSEPARQEKRSRDSVEAVAPLETAATKMKKQAPIKPSPVPPSLGMESAPNRESGPAPATAPPGPAPPRKWYPGMKDSQPPNKGSKRIPVGAAKCLDGLTFVITGTQDSMEREEVEALIKQYGGRVTGSVSGKTSFVLRGVDPETGAPVESSKVHKAQQARTPIIDEDGLLNMIRESAPQPEPEPDTAPCLMPAAAVAATNSDAPCAVMSSKGQRSDTSATLEHQGADPLWAEKYRPSCRSHLVGNADHVARLVQWLESWREQLHNEVSSKSKPGKDQPTFHKAALLSGPPGVGKTSSAKVILAQCGYDVVELNASDTRSQKALKEMAGDLVGNTSIAEFATGQHGTVRSTSGLMALIMDEVDGMSAGDRGGMAQLIATIKQSKMPVRPLYPSRACSQGPCDCPAPRPKTHATTMRPVGADPRIRDRYYHFQASQLPSTWGTGDLHLQRSEQPEGAISGKSLP